MPTIQIGAVAVEVYEDQIAANQYFLGASQGAPWFAASSTLRNQELVTATRVFNRTNWVGAPTEPYDPIIPQPIDTQPLLWPRTGITDRSGVVLPDDSIPQDVLNGFFEYALANLNNAATQTDDFRGTNTKATKSTKRVEGAVTVVQEDQFFQPTLGRLAPFPTIVQQYLGLWLSSSAGGALTFVSGADVISPLAGDDGDFGFVGDGLP